MRWTMRKSRVCGAALELLLGGTVATEAAEAAALAAASSGQDEDEDVEEDTRK